MKTYTYSRCPICAAKNIHVYAGKLAKHYKLPQRIVCAGTDKPAPEQREKPI